MKESRHIDSVSGVRDESFQPYETRRRIPWPVYSIVIALVAWGAFTLFDLDNDTANESMHSASAEAGSTSGISAGHELFNQYCATCHQEDGIGLSGAVPPLDGSPFVTAESDVPVSIVLMGISGPITVNGDRYNGRMPTFRPVLSDADIAAILSYVRQAWSNDADAVAPRRVGTLRDQLAARSAPLDGGKAVRALYSQGDETTPPAASAKPPDATIAKPTR